MLFTERGQGSGVLRVPSGDEGQGKRKILTSATFKALQA